MLTLSLKEDENSLYRFECCSHKSKKRDLGVWEVRKEAEDKCRDNEFKY